jgi:hypothetical protein
MPSLLNWAKAKQRQQQTPSAVRVWVVVVRAPGLFMLLPPQPLLLVVKTEIGRNRGMHTFEAA